VGEPRKNSVMKIFSKIKVLFAIATLGLSSSNGIAQITLYNSGMATVSIASNFTVTIKGNYIAQTQAATNGVMNNQGTLQLTGDWTNNNTAASPNPFSTNAGNVTFNGTALQNIAVGNNPTTFYDLKTNNSGAAAGGVTIASNTTVSNSLDLTSGMITTGANYLILTNTTAANLTYGTAALYSFINGNFRRYIASNASTYDFPVSNGTATTDRHLSAFVNNNLTGVSYIDAKVADFVQAAPNDDATLNTTQSGTPLTSTSGEAAGETVLWTFTPDAAPTGGNYGVRLYVENTTLSATNDDMFCPIQRSNTASYANFLSNDATTTIPAGGAAGRIYSAGAGYATRTGITFFPSGHQFGIGVSTVPLPVELLSFDAKPNGNVVDVTWVTASEFNNDYFTVEKSADLYSYAEVGKIFGAGNSSVPLQYALTDPDPYQGVSYYRLKQTDFNGNYAYYGPVAVQFNSSAISIFPNVSTGVFYISGINNGAKIVIHSASGQKISARVLHLNTSTIDLSSHAPGIYFIKVQTAKESFVQKVTVIR